MKRVKYSNEVLERAVKIMGICQAMVEGKQIECSDKGKEDWYIAEDPITYFHTDNDLRIKREPKLVPFSYEDADFLVGKVIVPNGQNIAKLICEVNVLNVMFGWEDHDTYTNLLKNYKFIDGSPCGKTVSEDPNDFPNE